MNMLHIKYDQIKKATICTYSGDDNIKSLKSIEKFMMDRNSKKISDNIFLLPKKISALQLSKIFNVLNINIPVIDDDEKLIETPIETIREPHTNSTLNEKSHPTPDSNSTIIDFGAKYIGLDISVTPTYYLNWIIKYIPLIHAKQMARNELKVRETKIIHI